MELEFQIIIKKFRLEMGLSQKELAVRIGVSQSYIAKLESLQYEKVATLKIIKKLSKTLGVCPRKILSCTGNCLKCKLR
ncbi:helix-turn-helix domain-containing protein [Clostridium botulinum]|uniref:helix-turn-helix domain-containing protein n=1 Tax=Clostridium botulinum TaxID=1491 RepID=UPI00057CB595|nr:helix-turn-helix transcriptional regulator [Clostridium botulinum]